MFEYIHETYPEAEEVVGGSWLYNLPAYRDSYPKGFTEKMYRLVPPGIDFMSENTIPNLSFRGDSVWGQFVDRRGHVRQNDYDLFVKKVESAQNVKQLVDAFPNQTLQPKAPIEVFLP